MTGDQHAAAADDEKSRIQAIVTQHANSVVNILDNPTISTRVARALVEDLAVSAIDKATALLRDRITELEKLGPLVEEYGADCAAAEGWRDSDWSQKYMQARDERDATKAKIDDILRGDS